LAHKNAQKNSTSNYEANLNSIIQGQTFTIWKNQKFNWNFFLFY